ncbi:MAG: peptidylprolyl isomerase [Amaricoccus sp.]|uniref:peptidylprolyl isomerase n=1 Tax=Amaricoccus sp. TaxID=1872485 RepID=UPI0039E2B9CF
MKRVALGAGLALAIAAGAAQADTLEIQVDGSVKGTVEIELLPDVAPKHVAQIEALAKAGAYDGVVFHRVIDGFMAQTGDVQFGRKGSPDIAQAGMGGSDMPDLKAEFSDIPFERGTVGMARAQDPNSANSQFFIMFAPAPSLNGQYTVVGKVIAGQDVVDRIRRGALPSGAVSDPDWMAKVTVKAD